MLLRLHSFWLYIYEDVVFPVKREEEKDTEIDP